VIERLQTNSDVLTVHDFNPRSYRPNKLDGPAHNIVFNEI